MDTFDALVVFEIIKRIVLDHLKFTKLEFRIKRTFTAKSNLVNCPNKEFFSGPYFPAFGLSTERYFVFSPNTGKYGLDKTPYLDTCHIVQMFDWVLIAPLKLEKKNKNFNSI